MSRKIASAGTDHVVSCEKVKKASSRHSIGRHAVSCDIRPFMSEHFLPTSSALVTSHSWQIITADSKPFTPLIRVSAGLGCLCNHGASRARQEDHGVIGSLHLVRPCLSLSGPSYCVLVCPIYQRHLRFRCGSKHFRPVSLTLLLLYFSNA